VPKCAEEASPDFRARGFFRAIVLALVVGVLFYASIIAIVAYIHPWQQLAAAGAIHESSLQEGSGVRGFATAVAFERAFCSRSIVNVLLAAALLSLLKIFNGNFIASSRLLFALGRRGLVNESLGRIHASNQTPSVAVIGVGLLTALATCLGESILIPITEVGSLASAIGWLATAAAYYRLAFVNRASGTGAVGRGALRERAIAAAGIAVASALILMKLVPLVPGHFTAYEYLALALWGFAGLALKLTA